MGKIFNSDPDEFEPNASAQIEETYERLFPKIGRDFIHRDDFIQILEQVLHAIDPDLLLPIDLKSDSEARKKALEYKSLLDQGKDGSKIYKDLIILDDDEEEEEI